MQTYELLVRERAVVPNSRDMTLVRTSVGIDRIHVLFDSEEWMGFPVTVTFAQGDESVTAPLPLSRVRDSDWAVEGECDIPWEVIGSNGRIRVTFQGTDSEGRHIITAKGSPLSVEEAGDVLIGEVPSDAPTVDQWQQAYAEAMVALNEAADLVASLRAQLDGIVSDARDEIDARAESVGAYVLPAATASSLGGVKVGDGLEVTADGTLSADGMTTEGRSEIARLRAIADGVTESAFESGVLKSAKVRREALPVATLDSPGIVVPDGITVDVDEDGMLYMPLEKRLLPATTSKLGGVKPDGTTITVDSDGTIHGTEQTPIATTSTTGKVKPDGTSITIDSDGTIHGTPVATTSTAGKVKPDGETITVDEDGTIHGMEQTPVATTSTAGKVKPDGTTITIDSDGTIHGGTEYRYGYVHDSVEESKAFVLGDESDGVYEFVNLLSVQSSAFSYFQSIRAAFLPVCMTVGGRAFFGCSNLMSVDLPVCTAVGYEAFYRCSNLMSVNLPACSVVGGSAFLGCSNLMSVDLPACSVVGGSAFYGCTSLVSASVPVAEVIGRYAFGGCLRLSSVNLPACTTVGEMAFAGCRSISTVRLPSVTTIGPEAFSGCSSLQSVSLPTVATIGSSAFYRCSSLASISLPKCETVNANAFRMCATLSWVSLPVCELVGSGAFGSCSKLKAADLSAGGSVLDTAFEWCYQMTYANLPRCTTIGRSAFMGCHRLVSLYLTGVSQVPTLGVSAFYSTPIGGYSLDAGRYGSVYVPRRLYGDFCEADGWSDIASRLVSR